MCRTVLLTVLALALFQPRNGDARVVPNGSDDGGSTELATHLPLDTSDERQLLSAALGMPATRVAIQECFRRGYVRRADYDRGLATALGTSAICFLGFEKPGYVAPPNCIGAPVVMVATLVQSGVPQTRVSEGLVILDRTDGSLSVWSSGTSSTSDSRTDAPFEVSPDRMLLDDRDVEFMRMYTLCAAISNSLCVIAGVGAGLVGTPIAGVATALVCISNRSFACLDRAFQAYQSYPPPGR